MKHGQVLRFPGPGTKCAPSGLWSWLRIFAVGLLALSIAFLLLVLLESCSVELLKIPKGHSYLSQHTIFTSHQLNMNVGVLPSMYPANISRVVVHNPTNYAVRGSVACRSGERFSFSLDPKDDASRFINVLEEEFLNSGYCWIEENR